MQTEIEEVDLNLSNHLKMFYVFSKFIHRQIKADERQVNTIVLWGGERGKPKKEKFLTEKQ